MVVCFTQSNYTTTEITLHRDDFQDLGKVKNILDENSIDMIWIETPTNPLLKVVDISGLVNIKEIVYLLTILLLPLILQNPFKIGEPI